MFKKFLVGLVVLLAFSGCSNPWPIGNGVFVDDVKITPSKCKKIGELITCDSNIHI